MILCKKSLREKRMNLLIFTPQFRLKRSRQKNSNDNKKGPVIKRPTDKTLKP